MPKYALLKIETRSPRYTVLCKPILNKKCSSGADHLLGVHPKAHDDAAPEGSHFEAGGKSEPLPPQPPLGHAFLQEQQPQQPQPLHLVLLRVPGPVLRHLRQPLERGKGRGRQPRPRGKAKHVSLSQFRGEIMSLNVIFL